MNDENNWLGAGMKVQLLKFEKRRALRDYQSDGWYRRVIYTSNGSERFLLVRVNWGN